MARAKAETATTAKLRSSKHPSKAFRKVAAPDVPEDPKGSGSSSSLDDDASGTEDDTDDSSSRDETDDSEDLNECGDQCSAACLAKSARLRKTAKRYFEGCELDNPFALRWAHLPDLPPVPTRYWSRDDQEIKWPTTHKELRHHARLGDARLEYLVPLILRSSFKCKNLPPPAVLYLQSNKVLGAIAFAYGFHRKGVAKAPHKQLHYYADMLEAYIETVFSEKDGYEVGMNWLRALWSSRCFPDLQAYIEKHRRDEGVPFKFSDLGLAYAFWNKKRKEALLCKPIRV